MIINSPDPEPKVIDEFDFVFSGGQHLNITIDESKGDIVKIEDDYFQFNIAEIPSPANPAQKSPAEHTTVFKKHLLTISHRKREIIPPTPEQSKELSDLYNNFGKPLSKSIN